MVVAVHDVIKSRLQSLGMKFSGVTMLQGVEFSVFVSILAWALQQCSGNALPVMTDEVDGPVLLLST